MTRDLQSQPPAPARHPYRDRLHAGQVLARELAAYSDSGVVVVALSRGGVPLAVAIAEALGAELNVLLVRKFGARHHSELEMGVLASGGVEIIDRALVRRLRIAKHTLDELIAEELTKLRRAEAELGTVRLAEHLEGRKVILVDDGVTTGATMRAAIAAARLRGAREVVAAVPVAAEDALELIASEADRVVCPLRASHFSATGDYYGEFSPVTPKAASALLASIVRTHGANQFRTIGMPNGLHHAEVSIASGEVHLVGDLTIPGGARGVVLCGRDYGSVPWGPRDSAFAIDLEKRGFATMLVDLQTTEESAAISPVGAADVHVPLLAERIVAAIDWLAANPSTAHLPLGLSGASVGAAAVLLAASRVPERIRAIVSRSGRPDLVAEALANVTAPVLLIVAELDHELLQRNRFAAERLAGPYRLEVVNGASRLFEESGKLAVVAELTVNFFEQHLRSAK